VISTLLDTGVVVALLDSSESYHDACRAELSQLEGRLVTCEAVIAESCYLLRDTAGASETILENVERGIFEIPVRLVEQAPAVRRLLRKYRSIPMDLADACLVDLAERLGTGRILTLDSDFDVYRWKGRRPFERLIELYDRGKPAPTARTRRPRR
jgi:uncharacterized protein